MRRKERRRSEAEGEEEEEEEDGELCITFLMRRSKKENV